MPNPARKPRFTPKTAAQAKADKYITAKGKTPPKPVPDDEAVSLDGSTYVKAGRTAAKSPETGLVVPFAPPVDPIPELVTQSRSAGRPTKYNQKVADEIVHRMSEGASILDISRDPDMPCRSTIMKWQAEDADFRTRIIQAREAQADLMDDLTYEVARNSTADTAPADRVKLTAYAWRAAHLAPKRYGAKSDVNINAQVDTTNRDILQYLSPEQREQLRALVMAAAKAADQAEDVARGVSGPRQTKQIEGVVRRS